MGADVHDRKGSHETLHKRSLKRFFGPHAIRFEMITDRLKAFRTNFNCLRISYGLPIPTSYYQKSVLMINYGITVADLNFAELITMAVAVTEPDFNFLNWIGNHFVTNGKVRLDSEEDCVDILGRSWGEIQGTAFLRKRWWGV